MDRLGAFAESSAREVCGGGQDVSAGAALRDDGRATPHRRGDTLLLFSTVEERHLRGQDRLRHKDSHIAGTLLPAGGIRQLPGR